MDLEKETQAEGGLHEGTNESEKAEDGKSEWLDILGSGQIKKKILVEGEKDTRPQRSDLCEINLEGRLKDGTIIEKYDNLFLHAGDGEVIQGVDLVLSLMDQGEQCLVEIGPRFAFGPQGRPAENSFPDVPGDVTVEYTLELLSTQPEPELEAIPIAERKRIGNRKRERGNWWYGRGDNTLAIQCYRRALDYLDEAVGGIQIEPDNALEDPDKEEKEFSLQDILEDRLKVYNNLAAAQLKIGSLDAALMSVENVLRCQPNNVKALFRKAKVLSEKGENQAASEVLEKITILDPENKTVHVELRKERSKVRENTKQQKNLYQKMMGGTTAVPKQRKTACNSRPKLASVLPWGVVVGSMAAVVAGMVAYRLKFV
ncbi:hypothetical protein ONE63_005476 [Megalurothrips usitatus]|uniref:peptidylprolyl isomerase n=1 Tax=Megalurothrips usitatus TaxID=439358 RepID=A0AAV7Y2U7_9NEOP|nr:hypothetical protein ONE63_005476 [Megalurothrips usitatus]